MLKPYLAGMQTLDMPTLEYVRYSFNNILPNHILYDLRTTFYTRCEECGVAEPARDEFVMYLLEDTTLYGNKGPYFFAAPADNAHKAYEIYCNMFDIPIN